MSEKKDGKLLKKFMENGGCLPSPEDKRDYTVETVSLAEAPLPEEYIVSGMKILNQGAIGSCHDADTEVLTKDGWKFFKDITYEDLLASVNPEDGDIIFEKPVNIIKERYFGEMVKGKHRSLDFLVTPNHKMVVRKWDSKNDKISDKYSFVDASELGWYSGLITEFYQNKGEEGCIVLEEERIANGNILPRLEIDMYDWVQLIGIYLAEGTLYKDGPKSHYRIQLAAVKKREKDYIRDLLARIGIRGVNEQKDRFHFCNKRIWKTFEQYGLVGVKSYDKFVPKFIFDLDKSYIKKFLYGFAMGDGCFSKTGRISYYTSSKTLANDLHILLLISGTYNKIIEHKSKTTKIKGKEIIVKHTPYHVYTWKTNNLSIDKKKNISRVLYDGFVYCAEVPTYHTLVTRRNGCVLLSGNCVAHACATSMGYGELQTGVESAHDFSRGYIYGNRSITDYQGEGMCTRQALKRLHHCGDCELKDFPYNESYPSVKARIAKNKEELAEKASKFKILNYFRCYSDDEIKRTIMANGSAIIAVPIYSSFRGDCPMPSDTDTYKGSHAMCIVGWDKTGWIIQNSWGKNWGKKGLLHLPYEYPITETWGITVSPTMPEPTKTSLWRKIAHWFKWLILQIKILFSKK